MRRRTILTALLAGMVLSASSLAGQNAVQWHGYVQLRYGRMDPGSGFSVRRAKLWMKGPVPGVARLSFKVQGIFRNGSSGAFVVQDVFAEYRRSAIALRIGQFVPDFSLQRFQPDYRVPLVERAAVVEALIPGARTLGREIGAEVLLTPASGWVHLAGGVFNGSGANHSPGPEGDYLATGRLVVARKLAGDVRGAIGGSVAQREAHGADVGVLSSSSGAFTGFDRRWGAEARLWGERWNIQGEYLHAVLDQEVSDGFYVLATLAVDPRDQVAVSEERLDAPVSAASAGPWLVVGYTRYLQAAPSGGGPSTPWDATCLTKVMTDVRVTSDDGRTRVGAAVQVQMFMR